MAEKTTEAQLRVFSLPNVFKLLASGNPEAKEHILDRKVLAHDQYGNLGQAVLSLNDDGNLVVTTEEGVE